MITKLIDNFSGRLTRDNIGDMNSGLAKYGATFGNNPFSNIGNLTWMETPVSILSTGSGAGPVVAMRTRIENNTSYVYAITTQAKLYKIAVNDTASKNPDYDTATLITTLTAQSPTVLRGGSIQIFGSTQVLFIGHDAGVTKINFDGTGESFCGALGSWVQNVPRPMVQFGQYLYVANGNNLSQIVDGGTVGSYGVLATAFPSGTYIRDLDVTPDGNYLIITVSRLNATQLDGLTIDTSTSGSVDSYRFLWNGVLTNNSGDYTSYESYNGYALTSNTTFGPYTYTIGYDLGSVALYSLTKKIVTLTNSLAPNFMAAFSTGNMFGFAAPEYDTNSNKFKGSIYFYGQFDNETPAGLFRLLRQTATQGSDVIVMPACTTVSNLFYVPPFYGYMNNIGGTAKLYFSTVEIVNSGGLQVFYNLFRFITVPTGSGTAITGVYETQQETSVKLFRNILKEKLKVYEIRVFTPPLVANNSFLIDLIGDDGKPIPNASYTFTVGNTDVPAGTTLCKYSPQMAPSYSIGIRITNLGSVNWTCEKMEVDVDEVKA